MRREAVYEYADENGTVLARKVKFRDAEGEKTYGWEHRTGEDSWEGRLNGWKPGLYLADVVRETVRNFGRVWLCEGEKDADAMTAHGYPATSGPNGAQDWEEAWSREFIGVRQVVVVADDDAPGRKRAATVCSALVALGVPALVVLPADGHNDAADHLAAGKGRKGWRKPSEAVCRGWLLEKPATAQTVHEGETGEGSADVQALLVMALGKVSIESRNGAGLFLACQLRDAGLPQTEAEEVLVNRYVGLANALGIKKDSPYSASEARESVRQAYSREARDPIPGVTHGFRTTDVGNAERFAAQHGDEVLYCQDWAQWLVWDGTRWENDHTNRVLARAKETTNSIYAEAAATADTESKKAIAKWAVVSQRRSSIESMISLARSEVPVTPDQLDADPSLFSCANGVIDLGTGTLLPHSKELFITKASAVPYDAKAKAPRWEAFLETVLPDAEVRAFVQKAVGYSLTAETGEQVLFIAYGTGQNGKSTFLEAVRNVAGEYSQNAPTEMLLNKKNGGGIPNDVARLRGARYVTAIETAKGRKMEETLVKQLTGGDTVTARFMRAEFFEFTPVAKIWMATNHKPIITGTDEGIWRRIRLLPFTVRIPVEDLDPNLPAALAAEAPGILAWAVRGAVGWKREGLAPPEAVVGATKKYRQDMDLLGGFLTDRCVLGEAEWVERTLLFNAYEMWCFEVNLRAPTASGFYEMLRDRDYEDSRKRQKSGGESKNLHVFKGIGLTHV